MQNNFFKNFSLKVKITNFVLELEIVGVKTIMAHNM
jgi:hypothetical protein